MPYTLIIENSGLSGIISKEIRPAADAGSPKLVTVFTKTEKRNDFPADVEDSVLSEGALLNTMVR